MIQVGLSPFQKVGFICFNENYLKMTNNPFNFILKALFVLNPIQDGGGRGGGERQKGFPTSFSPVTSTNVRISQQNFLTFSFNLFDRLV